MKLTKETLKRIVKEELNAVLNENLQLSETASKIEALVFSGSLEHVYQAESLLEAISSQLDPLEVDWLSDIIKVAEASRLVDASNRARNNLPGAIPLTPKMRERAEGASDRYAEGMFSIGRRYGHDKQLEVFQKLK